MRVEKADAHSRELELLSLVLAQVHHRPFFTLALKALLVMSENPTSYMRVWVFLDATLPNLLERGMILNARTRARVSVADR